MDSEAGEQLSLEIETVYLGPVRSPNPMVRLHGPGPEGATCGTCDHLFGRKYNRIYWKCGKRGDLTKSYRTDQRKRWMACGLYQEREES